MALRKPSVYIATLLLGVSVAGVNYTTVEGHAYKQPGTECGHPRGLPDAKHVAKRAWSKPYGPSDKDKKNWRTIKTCARTNYQREVRFPNLWHHYKSRLADDRKVNRLSLSCDQTPTSAVVKCIKYASEVHSFPVSTLMQIAQCESELNPYAYNPSGASGLFQFMPSTFSTTPYGDKSIYSARYSSLGAAWYMAHHGTGAWACA